MMNNPTKIFMRFFLSMLLVMGAIIPLHVDAAKKIKDQSKLSYGVQYKKMDYTGKSIAGRVDVMEVDVADMFTEVQLGKAEPLDHMATVRKRADSYHKKNNHISGAINANFFLAQQGKETRPVHLISEKNRLIYAGYVNDDINQFVNKPIAFGMDEQGKGLIDNYNLHLTYTYNGKKKKISHTNRERATDNTILYTSDFYKNNTDTNEYGTEVVLKGSGKVELTLGSTLTLEVTKIRKKGDKKPTNISDDAFVLSGHGKSSKKLEKMKVGDTVDINTQMDEKWQGSDFMIAGGPQLVKNGKVDISMNTDSWIAKARTSRTAVGVNKKRQKVFFVTADTSINEGMSIPELAKLMKDLGADAALNLDGGGSTTMAIRPNNKGNLKVANKLQDGFERGVSGILMAADTEPERIFTDVTYRDDLYEGIQWAKDHGTITGYEDHTFKPYNKLSRQHGAVIFTRAFDLDKPKGKEVEKYFTDVPSTHGYASEIAAVGQSKIFTGGENGAFSPNATLTREQMATTIVRAFGWEDSSSGSVKINLKNVDAAHRKNVQILADKGVTKEVDDFRPNEAVTRGQFAAFLQRASENK